MPANSKQLAMRQALVSGYLDADSSTQGNFAESVLAAGYSRISLTVRRTRYKGWIEAERRARSLAEVPSFQAEQKANYDDLLPVRARLEAQRERREREQAGQATIRFSRAYDQRGESHESATQWFRDDPAPFGTVNALDLTSTAAHERRVLGSRWNAGKSYIQKFPLRIIED